MEEFKLPDLGEGLQDAEIVSWYIEVGDRVVADQPMISVETDKAVVEVPAPHAGIVAALHGTVGERIDVGATLVEFEGAERTEDSGTIVGRVKPDAEPKPKAQSAPAAAAKPQEGGPRVKASAAVRALARKLGVEISGLQGSGPEGAITSADVEAASGGGAYEPLKGVRLSMSRNMTKSHESVVPVTLHDQADIGDWAKGTDITGRLVRAVAAGCMAEPRVNAAFDGDRQAIRLNDEVNLGMAVDTPEGLFVPVLRDVGRADPAALRQTMERVKAQVRDRSIPQEELSGATITLSNFGTMAGRHAQLVVSPPQVAILGAGRLSDQVVVVDGKPAVRRIIPLSLTFDHRALSGGEGARFLAAVMADLETAD